MAEGRKLRSGRTFLVLCVLLVFSAIIATVLLANDGRNLDLLLARMGYDPDWRKQAAPPAPPPAAVKGNRLPPPRIQVPALAFAELGGAPQAFWRTIQSDPRTLCETLRENGFDGLEWRASLSGSDYWECGKLIELPGEEGDSATEGPSLFVFMRGNSENRVTSFRLKLNLGVPPATKTVTDLATRAASLFLEKVRWERPETIVRRIHALETFDQMSFGSRIRFTKETSEAPRYNFLATQAPLKNVNASDVFYFDRSRWLPLVDLAMPAHVPGMQAGETGLLKLSVPERDPPLPLTRINNRP